MALKKILALGIILSFALCIACVAAEADRGAAPAFAADGSLLNETFNGNGIPPGWQLTGGVGNRKDVTVKDGFLVINPGQGDNNITLPVLPVNLDEDFVVEIGFIMPTPTTSSFSLFCMLREGGSFQVVLSEAGEARRLVMGAKGKSLGTVEPGKAYTFALLCQPDGTYKGTLTGPGIAKPVVQSVNDVDGVLKNMVVGNVFGAGAGTLQIDYVKVGKPAK